MDAFRLVISFFRRDVTLLTAGFNLRIKTVTHIILLIAFIWIGFSCGSKQNKEVEPVNIEQIETEPPEPTRAELVMKALQMAYPQDITAVEFRDDDWAVLMRDRWYYYCDGRLLSEAMRNDSANYRKQVFERYPAELPPFKLQPVPEPQTKSAINNAAQQKVVLQRSSFLDDLWQSHNRNEAYDNLVKIRFLGKPVRVHTKITNVLAGIEERILEEAKTDQSIQTWINSLDPLESWSWRNIAVTESRSFHSYGVAIDFRPKSIGRLQTYWLWTSQYRRDWFNVPYEERYHPPQAVIKLFEEHGFIWGGKWVRFDTMHFEYRPEILILSGIMPNQR